ncbi:methyltransferase domain-containing protein [Aliidiomarina celeris]|uniref:methyltransferase domain-containing protein n=1 Tax=Aliidiomarina celeris TaxID=2249428 RepID=UPI000DE9A222|nr:methyltransferase domain-containing protein [Aliidiomarina celeris]
MSDRVFSSDALRFAKNIYDTPKGRIRQAVLQADLAFLRSQSPEVLDIGAGLGQINQWLAQGGARVTHVDASADMVHEAQRRHAEAGLAASYSYQVAPLQNLTSLEKQYDVVLCHAALEWLDNPFQAIAIAFSRLKPGGWLSLMFYNRHAKVMANMVFGNHDYVAAGLQVKKKVRFSPEQPLEIQQVQSWVAQFPCTLYRHSGIRCFNDFLKEPERMNEAQLVALELKFRHTEPYRSLGRYQHFLIRKEGEHE